MSLLEQVVLSFSLSMAIMSATAAILYPLGTSLKIWGHCLLLLPVFLLLILIWKFRRRRTNLLKQRFFSTTSIAVILFAFICVILTYYGGFWLSHTADSFYHLKAMKEILNSGQIYATNVFTPPSQFLNADPTAGTWHSILALLAKHSSLDIVHVVFLISGFCTFILILSFYLLTKEIFRNDTIAFLTTIIYFVVGWEMKFAAVFYPNQIAYAFLWAGLFSALRYIYTKHRTYLILASATGFCLATIHLAFVELFIMILFLLILISFVFRLKRYTNQANSLQKALYLLVIVLLFSIPFIYFKFSNLIIDPDAVARILVRRSWLLPTSSDLLNLLGKSLFVNTPFTIFSVILILYLKKYQAVFLISQNWIVPIIMVTLMATSSFVPSSFSVHLEKIEATVIYSSFLVYGYLVSTWWKSLRLRTKDMSFRHYSFQIIRIVAFCMLIIIMLWGSIQKGIIALKHYIPGREGFFGSAAFIKKNNVLIREQNLIKFLNQLTPGSIILADPKTSYEVLSLTNQYAIAVPFSHMPLQIMAKNGKNRETDVWDFLFQKISLNNSYKILARYRVDYVLSQVKFSDRLDKSPLIKKITTVDNSWVIYPVEKKMTRKMLRADYSTEYCIRFGANKAEMII